MAQVEGAPLPRPHVTERPRASTARALGTVAIVATLVAVGLSVWIRASGALVDEAPDVGLDEPLPRSLPGGEPLREVPAEIAAAAGGAPVVGAARLDALPEDFLGCDTDRDFQADAELEWVVLSPDGLVVSMAGPAPRGMFGIEEPFIGPGQPDIVKGAPPREIVEDTRPRQAPVPMRARAVCTATWRGGHWQGQGVSFGPAEDSVSMGSSMNCCDERGFGTGSVHLPVPEGAAWMLQERGDWWLALPVDGLRMALATWKFRDGAFGGQARFSHVLWVDPAGVVMDESYPTL